MNMTRMEAIRLLRAAGYASGCDPVAFGTAMAVLGVTVAEWEAVTQ